jgi:hypothetical protein
MPGVHGLLAITNSTEDGESEDCGVLTILPLAAAFSRRHMESNDADVLP